MLHTLIVIVCEIDPTVSAAPTINVLVRVQLATLKIEASS